MIADIRLQHFRSYADACFTFGPAANVIVGPNASGKTNLLEAVLVVARGMSYRAKDAEMVEFGRPWARLDAHVAAASARHERTVKLQRDEGKDAARKSFVIDSQPLARLAPARTLPAVLFEPGHLLLLGGAPDLRRTFMDDLIEQTTPGFAATRRHYRRVLSQRNALLKRQPRDLRDQLFVWNLRLSELGGHIAIARQALVAQCNERIADVYGGLAARAEPVALTYLSRLPLDQYASALLRQLEASLELDLRRGFTAYGPHRDDLGVSLNGHPAQESASRGETRTLVLALKLLELQMVEAARGIPPLLLLDDVFSELDITRRTALTHTVHSHQTFITTTDADTVAPYADWRRIQTALEKA